MSHRGFFQKMTHFITSPPQKIFSRTLQILGFIAESGQYKSVLYNRLRYCQIWISAKYNKKRKPVFRIHTPESRVPTPDNKNITKVIAHMTTHHLTFIISSKKWIQIGRIMTHQLIIKNYFVSCPWFNPSSKQLNIGSSIGNEIFKAHRRHFSI